MGRSVPTKFVGALRVAAAAAGLDRMLPRQQTWGCKRPLTAVVAVESALLAECSVRIMIVSNDSE